MPLQVNELALTELSSLTGVAIDKLKAELIVESDTAPTETKIKDLLSDTVIMKKTDHATLLDNHGKNKFDDGKLRALTDLTKVALGEKSFDVTKDMKREDVWSKINDTLKSQWETEHGKAPDEKLKALTEEKALLQKKVIDSLAEVEKIKADFEQTKTFTTAKEKALQAVASISFEATGEVLSKQREVVLKNILSSYTHKIEDGVSVWYDSNGKKLVDNLQNPMTIEEIAKGEAIIFPTSKASNGRGDNSSKSNNHSSGSLDAELAKCTSTMEVGQLLTKRGLSVVNGDGRAILQKWVDMQKKPA